MPECDASEQTLTEQGQGHEDVMWPECEWDCRLCWLICGVIGWFAAHRC